MPSKLKVSGRFRQALARPPERLDNTMQPACRPANACRPAFIGAFSIAKAGSLPAAGAFAMQLGVVGLGRMGANIVRRLHRAGHNCVVYDRDPKPGEALAKDGAVNVGDLKQMVEKLQAPRAIWVMLPAGEITEKHARRPRGDDEARRHR
jgi:hypothetical protein